MAKLLSPERPKNWMAIDSQIQRWKWYEPTGSVNSSGKSRARINLRSVALEALSQPHAKPVRGQKSLVLVDLTRIQTDPKDLGSQQELLFRKEQP